MDVPTLIVARTDADAARLLTSEIVGTGYFDAVGQIVSCGATSTLALKDSTEAQQFHKTAAVA